MPVPGYREAPSPHWRPDAPVDLAEAAEFLHQLHTDNPSLGPLGARLAEVRAEVGRTGTYTHTGVELAYGAKLAWRNASRCIGRLYWHSLVVRDRRHVTAANAIRDELVEHLRVAGDRHRRSIRPVITVFAPAAPGRSYARVWNDQLIRYAGYRRSDGSVLGDPRYVEFTDAVLERGWRGKGDAFDVLPVVVQTPAEGVRLFDLPESAVWEVPIVHPQFGWFAELGLRWHAVPAIANMRLTIGGVSYPLAPFNGWYLGTEIGARNFADTDRYDLLPLVARRMGVDTTTERTLWRDRALVELNQAVLWSFDRAGARISDHHTESRHFLSHVRREERAGRPAPADWSWIVPPMSGAATPVFHRYYAELDLRPNFYLDAVARELGRTARLPAAGTADLAVTDATGRNGTGQSGTTPNGTAQSGTTPNGTGPNGADHNGADHNGVGHRPASCPGRGLVPAPRLPLRPATPPPTQPLSVRASAGPGAPEGDSGR